MAVHITAGILALLCLALLAVAFFLARFAFTLSGEGWAWFWVILAGALSSMAGGGLRTTWRIMRRDLRRIDAAQRTR